ncbi:hypothetical protein AAVH_33314 [Aphelenchoides avenae]|nr:hypothetical protein AAVH_33314 [Aphelenchus avenae]
MFETSNLGAKIVSSIIIVCAHDFDGVPIFLKRILGAPQRVGLPAPQCDYLTDFRSRRTSVTVESTAELFVFKNTKAGKRLDVYKWTAEEVNIMRRELFLLQIVDV